MTGESKLHVFCGKMAAGKTTLATAVSQKLNAVMLSEDTLLLDLYAGKVVDIPTYVEYSGLIKQALRSHIVELLKLQMNVVLDFPGNTHQQRQWFLAIAQDADVCCVLHWVNCTDDLCLTRLAQRAKANPERQATDTAEMFEAITKYFQPPTSQEGFIIDYCEVE